MLPWLKREFPARYPVSVRRVPRKMLGGDDGECDLTGEQFRIRIAKEMQWSLRRDAIIHEHAHAVSWFNDAPEEDPHTAEWGVAYARIYRSMWAWNFGRPIHEDEL